MKALAEDERSMRYREIGVKCRAGACLNTMVRPKNLHAVSEFNHIIGLAAGMAGGKRGMTGRMPILGQDDVAETLRQTVEGRDDFIAVWHCQSAGGAKVVLGIDDEEHIVGSKRDRIAQGRPHSICDRDKSMTIKPLRRLA